MRLLLSPLKPEPPGVLRFPFLLQVDAALKESAPAENNPSGPYYCPRDSGISVVGSLEPLQTNGPCIWRDLRSGRGTASVPGASRWFSAFAHWFWVEELRKSPQICARKGAHVGLTSWETDPGMNKRVPAILRNGVTVWLGAGTVIPKVSAFPGFISLQGCRARWILTYASLCRLADSPLLHIFPNIDHWLDGTNGAAQDLFLLSRNHVARRCFWAHLAEFYFNLQGQRGWYKNQSAKSCAFLLARCLPNLHPPIAVTGSLVTQAEWRLEVNAGAIGVAAVHRRWDWESCFLPEHSSEAPECPQVWPDRVHGGWRQGWSRSQ